MREGFTEEQLSRMRGAGVHYFIGSTGLSEEKIVESAERVLKEDVPLNYNSLQRDFTEEELSRQKEY